MFGEQSVAGEVEMQVCAGAHRITAAAVLRILTEDLLSARIANR